MRKPYSNLLLSHLAGGELQKLAPHLVPVPLAKGEVLDPRGETNHLYFVEAGVICLVTYLTHQQSVVVAMTGREGVGGALAVLGKPVMRHRLQVQMPGSALRMDATLLRNDRGEFAQAVGLVERNVQVLITEIAQSAICNRYHSGRERLARWLLFLSDCAGTTQLPVTHEALAKMVGGARSLVTTSLAELRGQRAIEHRRGVVTVHRNQLSAEACECYGSVTTAIKRFTASLSYS